jgi:hypothetical protein
VRGFGCALFIFRGEKMKLFEEDKVEEVTASDDRFYKYSMPIIQLYRDLTREYPDQYHRLELFTADMTKALLDFMVFYLGLDGRKARAFAEEYLNGLYGFTEEKFIARIGEEKFNEMVEKLYDLADTIK